MSIKQYIERLTREADQKMVEAAKLADLLVRFPDLRRHVDRWEKVAYCSASVNGRVTDVEFRYNCGCCSDSPLEAWPFVVIDGQRVYSDPPVFRVADRDSGGDVPYEGWHTQLAAAGLPEAVIAMVRSRLGIVEDDQDKKEE